VGGGSSVIQVPSFAPRALPITPDGEKLCKSEFGAGAGKERGGGRAKV
jgi:hypothetical protein